MLVASVPNPFSKLKNFIVRLNNFTIQNKSNVHRWIVMEPPHSCTQMRGIIVKSTKGTL
jgi:hypothetical protein